MDFSLFNYTILGFAVRMMKLQAALMLELLCHKGPYSLLGTTPP
ncbi:hypothetical protein BDE02_07G051700 [Populus trichocarpa]|nr:hypothetical protein BDE02_07G051700 [Populus trichocarpa]